MVDMVTRVYRLILVLLLLAAGVAMERTGLLDYLSDPFEQAYTMTLIRQHVVMVVVAMILATALGVTIGILFTRASLKRYAGIVMYIVGLGQTIPSLAVIAIVMSFMGIGFKPALFALFIYSVLPIARNTLAGINAVPNWLLDAAKGMGMNNRQILWHVELPNAMQVMLTGFRVSLVICIGTAALAFLIGAGGLGEHIFMGIDLMRTDKLLAGAVPTILLALLADYLCEFLGLLLVPRGLRLEQQT
ncbi:MAG: ABC transporter permease [Desulfobacteraceae bacterium]|nr:ABC transporter permease [Desulfobacteraceae bacterium]